MSTAFVFPGQGSQRVGMLADLAQVDPIVRTSFEEASAVLGYDLWRLCQDGPAESLNATERTQPALLVASVATYRLWARRGGAVPQIVAGHSLGEFAALVIAESIDFRDAVEIVRFRGRAMQEAVPAGAGAMAAILGLDDEALAAACSEAAEDGVVEPANFNSPGQTVIAGDSTAVQRAIEAAKRRGAKRALPLPVSAPFHCSLMKPAAERLRAQLAPIAVHAPRLRFVSSVDAAEHADPAEIRELLVRQVAAPVRWTATVRTVAAMGAVRIVECGPGKVLTGLNRRIDKRPDSEFLALEDRISLDAALALGAR